MIRNAILPASGVTVAPRPPPPRWGDTTLNQVMELKNAFVEAVPDLKFAAQTAPERYRRLNRLGKACRSLVLRAKELAGDDHAAAPVASSEVREAVDG